MTKPENAMAWIRPGEPCWYYPSPEMRKPFAAVVATDLVESDGELCVRLVELEERYVKRSGRAMVGRAPWYTIQKRRPAKSGGSTHD